MRAITINVLSLTTAMMALPGLAAAKAKPAAKAEAPTESAAARAVRLGLAEDTGALRDASLQANVVNVEIVTPESTAPERTPTQVAEVVRSAAPLSGALEALVAKQVARNEAAFDRCVAEARARDPQLRGTIELAVSVQARRASAKVVTGPSDAAFNTCVAQTAQALKLSLPDLAFPWTIALGRAPASPATSGSARAALP